MQNGKRNQQLIEKMTLKEKVSLLSGKDIWNCHPFGQTSCDLPEKAAG
jgi:hypothetical protein